MLFVALEEQNFNISGPDSGFWSLLKPNSSILGSKFCDFWAWRAVVAFQAKFGHFCVFWNKVLTFLCFGCKF